MYPAQALSGEFVRMFIVILSFAVPVGIHLAFLFRCLGMTAGYQHHPFILPSIPVPSWEEKVCSKYMTELLWVNLITLLLMWTHLQKLLTALMISMPMPQLGHFFMIPWFSQISRWPFILHRAWRTCSLNREEWQLKCPSALCPSL